jgi:hypothetical protein
MRRAARGSPAGGEIGAREMCPEDEDMVFMDWLEADARGLEMAFRHWKPSQQVATGCHLIAGQGLKVE